MELWGEKEREREEGKAMGEAARFIFLIDYPWQFKVVAGL